MKVAYILLEDGFEEIEALTTCDILRRANVDCKLVGMKNIEVIGSHGIKIKTDLLFDHQLVDMVILPGGLPGATNLKDNLEVIEYLNQMNQNQRWIAAICAAPIVLSQAGVIENKKVTSYPGFEQEIICQQYLEKNVVIDGNVITSRGPATTFDFAYSLVEILEINSKDLKQSMLYLG